MKHNVFTIRLHGDLMAEVERDAARRGLRPTTWVNHLVERGHQAENLERLLKEGLKGKVQPSNGSPAIPATVMQRLLFAACFSEAILKKLNASLNRSSSELGTVAQQARDQAQAETADLLKALGE